MMRIYLLTFLIGSFWTIEANQYFGGLSDRFQTTTLKWPPDFITHGPDHTPATHPSTLPSYPAYPGIQFTTKPSTTTKRTTSSTTTPAIDNTLSDNDQYFGSCGSKNVRNSDDQERIVGGQNADANEWPWIAVMFNAGRQFCGGSLIDNIHVLTAAHCIAHMNSWDVTRLTVHLGDHNIRSNTETKHIERKVKRLVRHRGFDSRTLYNDIAILTLDAPVPFSRAIRPVCLPSAGFNVNQGTTGTVVGWGSLRENGPQPSILQEVNLPIWTNNQCAIKYGPSAPGGIIESMICAGVDSKDSCSGDSGGPLVVNYNGKWTQIGLVSWGIGCGKGQYPGVYTRLTSFLDWIKKNTATY